MRVIETTLDEDLSRFSHALRQSGVAHRIFEERGRQVLELAQPERAEAVRDAYRQWRNGQLKLGPVSPAQSAGGTRGTPEGLTGALRRTPAVAGMLLLALLIYPWSSGLLSAPFGVFLEQQLFILDLHEVALDRSVEGLHARLQMLIHPMEPWRLLTPALLHFSIVHVLFNCAVCFDLGRRVELGCGSLPATGLLLGMAAVSNVGQYLVSGYPVFGGLSGVAYGLLGYILVSARRYPQEPVWQLNRAFAGSLLIFLVAFTSGFTEAFGLRIANGAHWAGLAAGVALALLPRRRA